MHIHTKAYVYINLKRHKFVADDILNVLLFFFILYVKKNKTSLHISCDSQTIHIKSEDLFSLSQKKKKKKEKKKASAEVVIGALRVNTSFIT